MMASMITFLLLACDGLVPEAEPTSSTLPAAPAAAADPIPVTDDPARYGDAWLVLLQSSKEAGKAIPPRSRAQHALYPA